MEELILKERFYHREANRIVKDLPKIIGKIAAKELTEEVCDRLRKDFANFFKAMEIRPEEKIILQPARAQFAANQQTVAIRVEDSEGAPIDFLGAAGPLTLSVVTPDLPPRNTKYYLVQERINPLLDLCLEIYETSTGFFLGQMSNDTQEQLLFDKDLFPLIQKIMPPKRITIHGHQQSLVSVIPLLTTDADTLKEYGRSIISEASKDQTGERGIVFERNRYANVCQ